MILGAAAHRATLPLDARVRPLYNPGLRSPNYIVPGLVGVMLTLTMVLVTAMAIVRERERGTLEQLDRHADHAHRADARQDRCRTSASGCSR